MSRMYTSTLCKMSAVMLVEMPRCPHNSIKVFFVVVVVNCVTNRQPLQSRGHDWRTIAAVSDVCVFAALSSAFSCVLATCSAVQV